VRCRAVCKPLARNHVGNRREPSAGPRGLLRHSFRYAVLVRGMSGVAHPTVSRVRGGRAMATITADLVRRDVGLTAQEWRELACFEHCTSEELATFGPDALARYRRLMLKFASATCRVQCPEGPQRAA